MTLIVWGAPAKLVAETLAAGVHITACKACADQPGVTQALEKMDIEVVYGGEPLTRILKNRETLLTV